MSLREAAAEIRGLIGRDAELFAGDAKATEFFEVLRCRLFDPRFDVWSWKRSVKIPRAAVDRIVAELGPLKSYLDKLRVRAAERLVRETGVALSEIALQVGFGGPRTFRRTFQRILGLTPQELRLSSVKGPKDGRTEDGDLSLTVLAAAWRRRATLGLAGESQLDELLRKLRRLYPRPGPLRHWRGYRGKLEFGPGEEPFIENRELRDHAWPVMLALLFDEKRAPARLRPLFRVLRDRLFDQDLKLESILERAGGGERSVWSSFRAAVGRPAWTYLREARTETAAILLLRTSFDVKQIGPLVGYASLPAFRKAFADFAGESPSEYRARARKLLPLLGKPPRDLEDPGFWQAALEGKLDAEEAWELMAYLERYRAVLRSAR